MEEPQKELNRKSAGGMGEIVKIACRAAYWFLLAASLVCVLLIALFPYGAMKFYAKAGNQRAAAACADHVLSRSVESVKDKESGAVSYQFKADKPLSDSEFSDALYYYALPYSAQFLAESAAVKGIKHPKTVREAQNAVRTARIYQEFNSRAADEIWQNDAMRYATENGALSAHPDLYRFETIVAKDYMRALYIADPAQISIETERLSQHLIGPIDELRMDDLSKAFAELTAVINMELDIVGYKDNGQAGGTNMEQIVADRVSEKECFRYLFSRVPFTAANGAEFPAFKQQMLKNLESRLSDVKSFIASFDTRGESARRLKRAYWARQLSLLTQSIMVVADIYDRDPGVEGSETNTAINEFRKQWFEVYDRYDWQSSGFDRFGNGADWYRYILNDYTANFNDIS